MSPKIKSRPAVKNLADLRAEPSRRHDATSRTGSADAATRVQRIASRHAGANHARHHVSRQTQA